MTKQIEKAKHIIEKPSPDFRVFKNGTPKIGLSI